MVIRSVPPFLASGMSRITPCYSTIVSQQPCGHRELDDLNRRNAPDDLPSSYQSTPTQLQRTLSRRATSISHLSFRLERLRRRHLSHDARTDICVFYCVPIHPVARMAANPQRCSDPGCSISLSAKPYAPHRFMLLSPLGYSRSFGSRHRNLIDGTYSPQMLGFSTTTTLHLKLLAALGYAPQTSTSLSLPFGFGGDHCWVHGCEPRSDRLAFCHQNYLIPFETRASLTGLAFPSADFQRTQPPLQPYFLSLFISIPPNRSRCHQNDRR